MTTFCQISCLILLLYSLNPVNATRSVQFHAGRSSFSTNYFSNFTIEVINNSVYLDTHSIKTLVSGFKSNLDFQIRLSQTKKYQSLFNYNVDVCTMMGSLKNTLFNKWFQNIIKYGNLMDSCPVSKGHYYINGWKLDSKLVPNYLHPGDYRIRANVYYGKYKTKGADFMLELDLEASIC